MKSLRLSTLLRLSALTALPLVACSGSHSGGEEHGQSTAAGEHSGEDGSGDEGSGHDADTGEHDSDGDGHDSDPARPDGDGDEHAAGADDDGGEHEDGADDDAGEHDADEAAAAGALTGAAAVEALRKFVAEFNAKEEHSAETVRVQHLLVSFAGTPRSKATRSRAEAEQLTADLWAQIQTGKADYAELIRKYTNDSAPGIYAMTATAPTGSGSYNRHGMVPAFGNAGWRLEVGEYGVAEYDPQASPFGWHIVKRIE